LKSNYFEQKLLPCYQQERGPIPGLYYEARGTLYEPHTGREVALGTRDVESYDFPPWLYDKILFIEKQGLWPIFKEARFAERYDMAIVAGEGYATEACRVLFRNADEAQNYQLFVVHDADPFGYNIGRTLREETARMPGYHAQVIDLGLKLEEALAMNLPAENFTRKKALPKELVLTDLERKYFTGRQVTAKSWIARRVELNALTAPDLVSYVDEGLQKAGVRGKVLPPADAMPGLALGIFRDNLDAEVDRHLAGLINLPAIKAQLAERLQGLAPADQALGWARTGIEADCTVSWREAVGAWVEENLRAASESVREAVREATTASLRSGITL
jgi:hypothetical protein